MTRQYTRSLHTDCYYLVIISPSQLMALEHLKRTHKFPISQVELIFWILLKAMWRRATLALLCSTSPRTSWIAVRVRKSPATRPNGVCYPEIWATSCCNWLFKVSLAAAWRVELGKTPNLGVLQWVLSCCHKTGLIEWELCILRRRTQRTRKSKSHSNGMLNVLFL